MEDISKHEANILRQLDKNPRISLTRLAKATKASKETTHYRLKKLEKEIITEFWAMIDLAGYNIHKVIIKNKSMGATKKEKFRKWLLGQKEVSWFADTEGSFDYIITHTTQNPLAFAKFMQKLLTHFGQQFHHTTILVSTDATITNEKFLQEGKRIQTIRTDFLRPAKPIDSIDQEILRQLSLNSRATYTALAKEVKLSIEATRQRVKQLEKAHIIGYKMRVDTEKLGLSYYHCLLTLNNHQKRKDIESYYLEHPQCIVVMNHVGQFDMQLEFVLPEKELETTMDDLREQFGEAIRGYELLKIRKEHTMHLLR